MNRDFHTRPRQAGARTQADYGRTVLVEPPRGCVVPTALAIGLWVCICAVAYLVSA